jgi:Fe2+ or Zn2+ uptake regulation protein
MILLRMRDFFMFVFLPRWEQAQNYVNGIMSPEKLTPLYSNARICLKPLLFQERGQRMHQYVNASNELLRKRGYRLTPQRFMIMSVIQEANEHLTVEQIAERVQERNPYVSLSTIYRTLELLRELGLVRENRLPGEQPRYETAEGKAHHHLVCRGCRAVIHLDEHLLGNLHEKLQEDYHFYGLTLDLVASGYCSDCWNALQNSKMSS